MLFFVFVKMCNSLDGHVVCFGGTRGEYDVLRLSPDKVCDMLEAPPHQLPRPDKRKSINARPFWLHLRPFRPPTHMHVSDYGDYQTDRYRKVALRQEHGDPWVSLPKLSLSEG